MYVVVGGEYVVEVYVDVFDDEWEFELLYDEDNGNGGLDFF